MVMLFNSMGRRREAFRPKLRQAVRVYVCGPTVYGFAHIGNARPAVVFDVLTRLLRRRFGSVIYVRNITDIDDKIIAAAGDAGLSCDALAAHFIEAYHADLAALSVAPPDIEPRATEHVAEMIAMIDGLLSAGGAYAADGHVFFHVPAFADYGRLSGADPETMIAGARVEVAPFKRDPRDFVLWKPSTAEQPGWESPWGRGRPGWHIECSAMIRKHLGAEIDIHGGGVDLRFPHHENEIAQGTRARFWLHNGHVTVGGAKMSKSVDNVLLVHDLRAAAPGEAIRYALLSAHYRQPLDWTAETLPVAKAALNRLYGALDGVAPTALRPEDMQPVEAALDDDLNTPAALAALHALAGQLRATADAGRCGELAAAVRAGGAMLGLLREDAAMWAQAGVGDPARVERLVADRAAARAARDWARADALRAELAAMGVAVEDAGGGSRWRASA